jgi:hypothetical protein
MLAEKRRGARGREEEDRGEEQGVVARVRKLQSVLLV